MLERKSFKVNNIIGTRSKGSKKNQDSLPVIGAFKNIHIPQETKSEGNTKDKKKDKITSSEVTIYGIKNLFKTTDLIDKVLMAVGFMFAVFNGAMLPFMALIFGKMTNELLTTDKTLHNSTVDSTMVMFTKSSTSSLNQSSLTIDTSTDYFSNGISKFTNAYLIIAVICFICSFIQIYCWETASERLVSRLRKTYFAQILRLDIGWFDQNDEGDLAAKLTDDFERMRNGLGSKVPMITQFVSQFISGMLIGYYTNWKLSLVICFVGPIIIITSSLAANAMTGAALREQLRYGVASGIATEVLTNVRTVVAFGNETKEVKRYDQAMEDGRLQAMNKYYSMAIAMSLSFALMYGTYALGFWYGSTLFLKQEAAPGDICTVFFSVLVAAFSIGHSLPVLAEVANAVGASSVVFSIISLEPQIDVYSDEGEKPSKLEGKIFFKDVKFTYPARSDVEVLKGLNLTINAGSVVALVGQSGAGKSTLVGLLMRFYDPTSGEILIDGKNMKDFNLNWLRCQIGVVSQEPVLFGVSIADNIKFGNRDASHEEMVNAAKLANAHEFITNFPNGYDTLVGDLGTMMSGGQKQRIAIARALVRNPRILLLDEATSALDSMSETAVQQALDKAMQGRTTVIIAHRLSTIRNADVIYALKDGVVAEYGTHTELMSNKGVYFSLVMSQNKKSEDKECPQEEMSFTDINLHAWKRSASLRRSRRSSTKSVRSMKEDEADTSEEIPSLRFLDIIKLSTTQWPLLAIAFACCFVNGFNIPCFSIIYSEIIQVFLLPLDELRNVVPFWCEMFIILAVATSITYFIAVLSASIATEKLIQLLRTLTFKNILSQQISFFDNDHYTPPKLTNTLAKDPPLIKVVAGMRAGIILLNGVTLISAIGITFFSSWKLALVTCSVLPALILVSWKQCDLKFRQYEKEVECMEDASKMASECVQNVRTVRMLGLEKFMTDNYTKSVMEVSLEVKKQGTYFALTYGLTQCSLFLVYSMAYRYGAYLLDQDEIAVNDIYRVVFALGFSFPTLGYACIFLQDFIKSRPSISYIFKLMKLKSSLDTFSEEGLKPVIKGKVMFKNVEFSYPSRKHIQILRGLDLNIEPGQTVALVGGSGSGKSTVISLLERFYSPDKGQIMVDDIDVTNINVQHLRNAMGIVTQEPTLFDCSIKDNIAYGSTEPVTDQQIIQAAIKANIHDFITRLPQGYETPAGDRGMQLSGGQKQRIAIARALIRDPKILLLDEATSALDNESEKVVQEALDKARKGRTSIIVAHRLSTIRDADMIVVIKNGKVIERGTHQQLKNLQGHYYNLIKKQEEQEE